MEKEQLDKVLAQHKRWLTGKGGKRADLFRADLSGAYLKYANLKRANLAEANLAGADLTGADLEAANLTGANLYGADLSNANLSRAVLRDADLERADIERAKGVISFGSVGKKQRIGYAVKHDNCVMVQLGCFWGSEEEAIESVKNKYGSNSDYEQIVRDACRVLKET